MVRVHQTLAWLTKGCRVLKPKEQPSDDGREKVIFYTFFSPRTLRFFHLRRAFLLNVWRKLVLLDYAAVVFGFWDNRFYWSFGLFGEFFFIPYLWPLFRYTGKKYASEDTRYVLLRILFPINITSDHTRPVLLGRFFQALRKFRRFVKKLKIRE